MSDCHMMMIGFKAASVDEGKDSNNNKMVL